MDTFNRLPSAGTSSAYVAPFPSSPPAASAPHSNARSASAPDLRSALQSAGTRLWRKICTKVSKRRARLKARIFAARTWVNTHILTRHRPGVRFVGYVEGGLGLGQTLRSLISAYGLHSSRFAIYPFRIGIETRMIGPFQPERYNFFSRYKVTVLDVTAEQLPTVYNNISPHLLQGSKVVLRPFWELPAAPQDWAPQLERVDEIWAPNAFVGEAFRKIFKGDIHIVRPCVDVTDGPFLSRKELGLAENIFYYLFSFDYYSFPSRKNPLAVLRAFASAFPDGGENVGLVIKTNGNRHDYPAISAALQDAADRDSRIQIIERDVPRQRMVSLIRACDCYVSLHRSEGFGSGMAEAMLLGRRVVGTNFSGNTDFLSEKTGFPVDYDLVPVPAGEYPWSEGQVWADPRHESAVAALRTAYFDTAEAETRAAAGQALIRESFGPHAVGAAVAARVEALQESP